MSAELSIEYQGNKLDVVYQFKKGLGYISRDIPPDENELNVLSAKLPDGTDYPMDEIGIRWDIEMMIMEKIVD